MASAVKILPPGIGRWYAKISLLVCCYVYAFTGWVGFYPIILGATGLIITRGIKRGREGQFSH